MMEIVSAGPERIAELEPLWVTLTEHHGGIAPVAPAERRNGIGSALLDRVREELRAGGCTHWGLGVVATNEAAIRFYRQHGFAVAFLEMLGRP